MCEWKPVARVALLSACACCLLSRAGLAQTQEPETLPSQPPGSLIEIRETPGTVDDRLCPPLTDPPLTSMGVDIRPRDVDGQLVPAGQRPTGCWEASGRQDTATFVSPRSGCCRPTCRQLLQLARFCHPRVCFEDYCMERCGASACCPPAHAIAKFTIDLALLPARMLVCRKPPCVRTPTPLCCKVCGQ